MYHAAGCFGCHTDRKHGGSALAGGRALQTPFGTFYSPNITPDPESGIGKWSEQDFIRAMRFGMGPNGKQLYPVFPYTSYTQLSDDDLHALWTYLRTRPAVKHLNQPHDLKWFVSFRAMVGIWKALYFTPGQYKPEAQKSASWNRGAYLVKAMAHCGECHTPRNILGTAKTDKRYAGMRNGPEDSVVSNITPDKKTGIGKWSTQELVAYLETGMRPDGDTAEGLMADVIDDSLQYLNKYDLAAVAEYIQSLPAVENVLHKTEKKSSEKEVWE